MGLVCCRPRALRSRGSRSSQGRSGTEPIGELKPVTSSVSRRDTIAELAVSEIGPITSVRGPRYFGERSLVGARVSSAKGGRTDRWPQMTAIPLRIILLYVLMI